MSKLNATDFFTKFSLPELRWTKVFERLILHLAKDGCGDRLSVWHANPTSKPRWYRCRTGTDSLERVAMTVTGHKTRSILARYNIVTESDQRQAAARLAEYVGTQAAAPAVVPLSSHDRVADDLQRVEVAVDRFAAGVETGGEVIDGRPGAVGQQLQDAEDPDAGRSRRAADSIATSRGSGLRLDRPRA